MASVSPQRASSEQNMVNLTTDEVSRHYDDNIDTS